MVHTTSRNVLFAVRGWTSPCGFFKLVFLGSSSGRTIEISRRRGYQIWDWQVGVTSKIFLFGRNSLSLRLVEWGKLGKCIKELIAQICCRASAPWLKGSGFQLKYWGNWWDSLDANKSTLGVSLLWQTCWSTFGQIFYSDGSLLFRECQSASTFKELGRYSAVIVIWCFKRYC